MSAGSCLFLLLYLAPTVIAYGRSVRNTAGLAVLNLLLGWTILGWIAALIWALSGDTNPAQNRSPLA